PVSGTSYPMLIGLLALAGLLELLELQAASTSGVASRSANGPYRAELPRTLMYISLVGPRAWLLITSETTMEMISLINQARSARAQRSRPRRRWPNPRRQDHAGRKG